MEPKKGKKITINTQASLSFPRKSLLSISTKAIIQKKQTKSKMKAEINSPKPANMPIQAFLNNKSYHNPVTAFKTF